MIYVYVLAAFLGLLPVLPILIKGSPVLNNDMLVAYFCYFWDFHRNWSWSHPLVFWSSSYQCGMPMHAYWQSGFLYPITWLLFGPLSPHYGIYFFYALHFFLGISGFLRLGPRLGLGRAASLWAGICFALCGTMLARYEHATFLAGWAWMPLVLSAFLALRDDPRPKALFWYAGAVALQALGGHPQASLATAFLIAAFTVTYLLRKPGRRAAWVLGGHLLTAVYCAPMLVPFLQLVDQTDRFDGVAWEGGKAAETAGAETAGAEAVGVEAAAAEKLETGVFGFEKFATGGLRPLHLLSLIAPHALGSPANASWWGGEAWGEVFVYLGGLGLFFCFFASPKRARRDLRLLLILGLAGLWLSFGAHLGASQILYHVPVLNNFRRPARFLILFAFALAALSAHGLQRWLGHPRGGRWAGRFAAGALALAGGATALRFLPDAMQGLLVLIETVKELDPAKDYARKLSALLDLGAGDLAFLALSGIAVRHYAVRHRAVARASGSRAARLALHRTGLGFLFLVLAADLIRVHWDHFYLFPADYYRRPPESVRVLDRATAPFWRVSHYLEYPGLEMWEMHNDPVAHFDLLEREKTALSCGIHAVFGYRHVTAHLPLLWKWDPALTPAGKSARYLFSNRALTAHKSDSLAPIGRFGSVNVYELTGWRPRIQTASNLRNGTRSGVDKTLCPKGFFGYAEVCVREERDGDFRILSAFLPGDTLIVRERFSPEWKYRLDGGSWQRPLETPDHFIAMPLWNKVATVDLTYSPRYFYGLAGFGLALTAALAGFFRFRKKPSRG